MRDKKGKIEIWGLRNAVLPMITASVLYKGTTVLTHIPRMQNISCMMGVLEYMECRCSLLDHELTIDASYLTGTSVPETYVKTMRSSIMILGALFGHVGKTVTHYPGGCSIGKRPIDLHLSAFRKLGAEIEEDHEVTTVRVACLHGTDIHLSYSSVGTMENAVLAAVLAERETRVFSTTRGPEIEEMRLLLNQIGARISGIGSGVLVVCRVEELHDTVYRMEGDRIVAGTYLASVTVVGGHARFYELDASHLLSVLPVSQMTGVTIQVKDRAVTIRGGLGPQLVTVETGPYLGSPTNLQSSLIAMMVTGAEESLTLGDVFEGRYEAAGELRKLGAQIIVEEETVHVRGISPLYGDQVEAKDLRGDAALVVAGPTAEEETVITGCHHIFRGYEDICRDISSLGAQISKQQQGFRRAHDRGIRETPAYEAMDCRHHPVGDRHSVFFH